MSGPAAEGMSPGCEDDVALVVRTLAGDRAAFGTLVDRYEEPVRRVARAMLHDVHDADGAVGGVPCTPPPARALGRLEGVASWSRVPTTSRPSPICTFARRSAPRSSRATAPGSSLACSPEWTRCRPGAKSPLGAGRARRRRPLRRSWPDS